MGDYILIAATFPASWVVMMWGLTKAQGITRHPGMMGAFLLTVGASTVGAFVLTVLVQMKL